MKTENQENVFEPMPGMPADAENPVDQSAQNEPEAVELTAARKNMFAGLLWCVGGLAFTFITYYFASAGGRYFIATGAVIWGFLQACKGLFTYQRGNYTAFWRMAAAAVCIVCVLSWLGVRSMQLGQEEQPELLDTEQTYACDELNLHLTIPAGYSAYTEEYAPETDSTYTFYQMDTYSNTWAYRMEAVVGLFETGANDLAEFSSRQAADFYTDGIIAQPQPISFAGYEMYCSEGRKSDAPEYIYALYNIRQGESLVGITFAYPKAEYGKAATRKKIEELLGKIELTGPETTAR